MKEEKGIFRFDGANFIKILNLKASTVRPVLFLNLLAGLNVSQVVQTIPNYPAFLVHAFQPRKHLNRFRCYG